MSNSEFNFTYKNESYILVDCPGHKLSVKHLISGINNYDTSQLIGCIVVSVIENEYNAGMLNGQTKENIILLKASGVNNIIIVFNKMDIINWNNKILEERKQDICSFIDKMNFKQVDYIGLSAFTGENILKLLDLISNMYNQIKVTKIKTNEVIEEDRVDIQLKIISCENIISGGYECILHSGDKEYQVIILGVKCYDQNTQLIKSKFAREGDIIISKIKRLDNVKMKLNVSDRIIIRKNDNTIAFGKIIK
jgi:translation elongation factor EF-1alpha